MLSLEINRRSFLTRNDQGLWAVLCSALRCAWLAEQVQVRAATEAEHACPPAQLERPEGMGGAGRASVAKAARP